MIGNGSRFGGTRNDWNQWNDTNMNRKLLIGIFWSVLLCMILYGLVYLVAFSKELNKP